MTAAEEGAAACLARCRSWLAHTAPGLLWLWQQYCSCLGELVSRCWLPTRSFVRPLKGFCDSLLQDNAWDNVTYAVIIRDEWTGVICGKIKTCFSGTGQLWLVLADTTQMRIQIFKINSENVAVLLLDLLYMLSWDNLWFECYINMNLFDTDNVRCVWATTLSRFRIFKMLDLIQKLFWCLFTFTEDDNNGRMRDLELNCCSFMLTGAS